MKVAILGGTGDLGKGLALRLSASHEVIVGSRDREKARAIAEQYNSEGGRGIVGMENQEALKESEISILAIPAEHLQSFLQSLQVSEGKHLVVPVVPMYRDKDGFHYRPYNFNGKQVSAAELVKAFKPYAIVSSAFHTVPAERLANISERLNYDVLVASEGRESYGAVAGLVSSIDGLRPYYVGGLSLSMYLEMLTPLILNIALRNGLHAPSIRVV